MHNIVIYMYKTIPLSHSPCPLVVLRVLIFVDDMLIAQFLNWSSSGPVPRAYHGVVIIGFQDSFSHTELHLILH